MPSSGNSGVLVYAKDLERLVQFHAAVLGLHERHRSAGHVVLARDSWQLELHAIPAEIAQRITITAPPQRREDVALKFFVSVPSLAEAGALATRMGGACFGEPWAGPGYRACNAMDCEGNVFQLRQEAPL